jgi:hypothetical protein
LLRVYEQGRRRGEGEDAGCGSAIVMAAKSKKREMRREVLSFMLVLTLLSSFV